MYNNLKIGDYVLGANNTEEYRIIKQIGRGGFGEVYKIMDEANNQFALKIITDIFQEVDMKSLLNEGYLQDIEHENVIKVKFFHDGKLYPALPPYIIMEYADGGTLKQMLAKRSVLGNLFDNNELVSMFLNLASGMKAINEKVVHRDIKPDNILISQGTLKITDFGISKIVGAKTRSDTLKACGTYRYAAPEYWDNSNNQQPMDVYSMGIVFYEIATLKHPYFGADDGNSIEEFRKAHLERHPTDIMEYNAALNSGLAYLISRMMSKPIGQRPHSWDNVIDAIKQISNVGQSIPVIDQLLDTSRKKDAERQRTKTDGEIKFRQRKELESRVAYSFRLIVSEIEKMLESFNQSAGFPKLSCYLGTPVRLEISGSGHARQVVMVIAAVHENHFIDNKKIMAWGYVKAPSGKGNNLLLLANDENDSYGIWEWLQTERQAGMALSDARPEPIPLEFDELSDRISRLNMNSLDKYIMTRKKLDLEQIPYCLHQSLSEIL